MAAGHCVHCGHCLRFVLPVTTYQIHLPTAGLQESLPDCVAFKKQLIVILNELLGIIIGGNFHY